MGYELGKRSVTGIANADLSSYQYYGVKMNSSGKIVLASTGDAIAGVLQDAPDAADRACEVAYGGLSKAIGGAIIAAGAEVQVDATGRFVTKTTGERSGIAWEACGGAGQQFTLLLKS